MAGRQGGMARAAKRQQTRQPLAAGPHNPPEIAGGERSEQTSRPQPQYAAPGAGMQSGGVAPHNPS